MDKFEFPIIQEQSDCGCGVAVAASEKTVPDLDQSFVSGFVDTPAGRLPQVSSALVWQDRWGSIKARWGVGRMDYSVNPGIYALGTPDNSSPVFVSANYKMSFDRLRQALAERSGWILVLDTKGINVWCAAGKGTFGTDELVRRIESSSLKNIVSHRKLILPQLGAPGVAAHKVKQMSGFKVQYGPVRAEDLPAYLDGGFQTTAQMRIITFPLKERAVLIPIELVETIKPFLMIAPLLFLFAAIAGPSAFWTNAASFGLFAVWAFLCAIIGGAVLNPLLLPYLPGRAFSIKGFSIGMVIALIILYLRGINLSAWAGRMEALAWFLIIPAVSGYLAMNFTGASTYTSLSGVKKEMRWALPLEIACGAAGVLMWMGAILIY
ncbi:MAG: acetyl-CoA synthase subunit gamma [Deltaproteobacteria bacterium HGW-Deltaproteobacteria-13]|jgi:acetyl-CoA decarbonylase/synthase complex subunit gamma|nr:MAG: acetyl-CoA synthase subunit gamma [Deltaproteobacteria bacterium HGW-Deltaproteobacteria-13]